MKLRVGFGSCGIAAGGRKVREKLAEEIKNHGRNIELISTGCIGMCFYEPIVDVIDNDRVSTYANVTPEMAEEIFKNHVLGGQPLEKYIVSTSEKPYPILAEQVRIALRNCGIIDPENLDDYLAKDGYKALAKVIKDMTPEEVIEEIKISGLRGRGGAGFPTWFKWNAARQSKGDIKYVVCNADEGDPGAFMDRSVLEGDPHALLEGMIICGYAIGAREGHIYCRAEYPLAIKRLEIAIADAKKKNLLGDNIMGTNFSFDMNIKKGAGAFVCGEETALIASLEGERGMPRLKPPFPAQSGFWGKPTNINNVETFANVPWILYYGGSEYAKYGTEKSKGTKVFALAGKIKNGGLVEVPMGMTLREVIYGIGGGILNDKDFKAVQMGGPSGGCIPKQLLDTPVDYDSINQTGAIMGSGGMIVMDEDTCMVDMARFFLDFTVKESCGKCIYCRIGTKRMLEILERITAGEGREGDIEELEQLSINIKDGSLCGLGQTAPNPVLTTIRYFRDEYEAHIRDKKCPAKTCKPLLTYTIWEDKCKGCTLCAQKCPVQAITGEKKQPHKIDQALCTKCGSCLGACRFDAVCAG
ncbi:MAG TPA: NADH-ubiquinone oxidoreductase-F iron-sulfur binding region domain-containing protein [Methylomusa anaerophila]|uniref:NADP-reducing hydrogenase subunit HndC n=1 Tax=Methylomusa anaerophila TaxID=1930071 RepID=A0A348AFH9_9FIRM|nr:NADH-ubiquinone oxidoreductase-F iron-sulfur binding region domain-containing protein [Methylomusa anaerophila]BBB89827.1 NADP-reducing hydrogenase subunit HndC [Methylomusa anaerophila]HML89126.1 NADH-ubiquinone oxidoreductase-F iron-sulfur binding region domain-containing protein [Methylomusa anaerophila]